MNSNPNISHQPYVCTMYVIKMAEGKITIVSYFLGMWMLLDLDYRDGIKLEEKFPNNILASKIWKIVSSLNPSCQEVEGTVFC